MILVHNHPSGDPTPSPDDLHLTAEALAAGRLLDIQLLDHLVIGHDAYVSRSATGASPSTGRDRDPRGRLIGLPAGLAGDQVEETRRRPSFAAELPTARRRGLEGRRAAVPGAILPRSASSWSIARTSGRATR